MRQLIGYLKTYFKEHVHPGYFIFILLYTATLLFLNFYFEPTSKLRNKLRWADTGILYYLFISGLGLVIPYLAQSFFEKKENLAFLRNRKFWGLVLFALLLWSTRNSLIYYYQIYLAPSLYGSSAQSQFEFRFIFMLLKSAVGIIPLVIYWYLNHRKEQPLYGMHRHQLNLKPYFILLLMMIPIIALASQNTGFLSKYPRLQVMPAMELFNPDHSGFIAGYETLYILDFYAIELFFRGFMILAFMKLAGPKAILPVAVFYVTIHFGKPFGEALSSFFGGTILGIITFYSRSIWGGIIIHMGIALAMEVSAYLTHYLRQ